MAAVQMTQSVTPADGLDLRYDSTITDTLLELVAEDPQRTRFRRPVPAGEALDWQDVSGEQFVEEVSALAKGLIASGLKPGDRIALFGETSYEWTLCDYAIWFAGGVSVPFYDSSSRDQLAWMIDDSRVSFALVQSSDHAARVAAAAEVSDHAGDHTPVWVYGESAIADLSAAGAEVPDGQLEAARTSARPDSIATIIYTSGTTGKSKGCVLTHGNFVQTVAAALHQLPEVFEGESVCLLFLPLAHVFARFVEVLAVSAGSVLAHTADLGRLTTTLGEVRPTYILGVPRVFEKVFNSAFAKAEAGGKAKIFRAAEAAAVAYSRASEDDSIPFGVRAKRAVFDKLVFAKLREVMGGRLKYAVSGGGPLGEHLGHFYRGMGLVVLEGYGLTETTAPVTVNIPARSKMGTVGIPLPGCGIAIAPDGEVLAKGVCVFREYLNNDAATEETFYGEWARTGDIGELDADGYLKITGRKKELIVTSGGKNVAPAPLEDELRRHPIIGQPVVVGDNRNFISALIFLDPEMLPGWLQNKGLDPNMSLEDAAENERVRASIAKAIERVNQRVSRAESIREFRIVPAELSEATGHLSAKQSVKRHIVLDDFSDHVDDIYGAAPPAQ